MDRASQGEPANQGLPGRTAVELDGACVWLVKQMFLKHLLKLDCVYIYSMDRSIDPLLCKWNLRCENVPLSRFSSVLVFNAATQSEFQHDERSFQMLVITRPTTWRICIETRLTRQRHSMAASTLLSAYNVYHWFTWWPSYTSLQQLHWLPVKQWMQYKLCTIMYAVHHGLTPSHISESRSCSDITSKTALGWNYEPRIRTKFGEQAFSHTGPAAWNTLPDELRQAPATFSSFKRKPQDSSKINQQAVLGSISYCNFKKILMPDLHMLHCLGDIDLLTSKYKFTGYQCDGLPRPFPSWVRLSLRHTTDGQTPANGYHFMMSLPKEVVA